MKRATAFGSVLAVVGLAALGLTAAASLAQNTTPMGGGPMGGGGGAAAMMMQADTNGDGIISADEIRAHQQARFAQMDVNHDGQLSSDEMGPPAGGPQPGVKNGMMNDDYRTSMREQRHEQMLTLMDSDHNGTVSEDEFNAFEGHRMMMLDSNHNGQIDHDELQNTPRGTPYRMVPQK